jgi:hypothetical protein
MSKTIIPNEIYVGAASKSSTCMVTAHGTDKVAQNRMDTLHRNCGGEANCMKLENEPLLGFELRGSVYKDQHRVRDPRGFDVCINNYLMDHLLQTATIVRGVIQQPCVYARTGGNTMLLNCHTEKYSQAVLSTQVANSKASWKNVKPGNLITLKTGVKGTYMGKFRVLTYTRYKTMHDTSEAGDPVSLSRLEWLSKPQHVILENRDHKPRVVAHVMAAPNLAVIEPGVQISEKHAEQQVNDLMRQKSHVHLHHNLGYSHKPILFTSAESDHELLLTPVAETPNEILQWVKSHAGLMYDFTMAKYKSGELVTLTSVRSEIQGHKVSEPHLTKHELRYHLDKTRTFRNQSYAETCVVTGCDQIEAIFNLEVSVNTKLGNHIQMPAT